MRENKIDAWCDEREKIRNIKQIEFPSVLESLAFGNYKQIRLLLLISLKIEQIVSTWCLVFGWIKRRRRRKGKNVGTNNDIITGFHNNIFQRLRDHIPCNQTQWDDIQNSIKLFGPYHSTVNYILIYLFWWTCPKHRPTIAIFKIQKIIIFFHPVWILNTHTYIGMDSQ